ncbi:MAG: adenylate/guanylate cyclase domain-containing protein [Planctomycetia bacterium]|nr:adenylate/guanylate cyclase domain-containing protein [Planctomycetia bacterium]
MAYLIVQGPENEQRWRQTLAPGAAVTIGRSAGPWSVPWDDRISRRHVELLWQDDRLQVRMLPAARNPVFFRGREEQRFELKPGEHFVIGRTRFSLVNEPAVTALETPIPVEEQTFTAQYLQELRFRNPDHRIEVLSRLPQVIENAASDHELFVRLVNMLLSGIPRATAAAIVALEPAEAALELRQTRILYWDSRVAPGEAFQPSTALVRAAIERRQSVLHVWEPSRRASPQTFTASENYDWAFCTPVLGKPSGGWSVYVAGRFEPHTPRNTPTDGAEIKDDLKFAEMVGGALGSLRELKRLQRQKSSLGQFLSPAVLEALEVEDPDEALAPRETEVSVLFCDLRGFSRASEKSAQDLLGLLKRVSEALGVLTHHILSRGGVVGDFHGDAAMGFWGWPLPQPDAAARACAAALAIRKEYAAAALQPEHSLADFQVGIGLATGRAVAGKIGTFDQTKVTVFGPVVNLASRLEGMTKLLHAPILMDGPTADALRASVGPDVARFRRLALVRPYGLETPVMVTELLPPAAEYPQLTDAHLAAYERAVDALLAGRWTEALQHLQEVPAHDQAKDFLTVFIGQHNRIPPADWDGVIALKSKG